MERPARLIHRTATAFSECRNYDCQCTSDITWRMYTRMHVFFRIILPEAIIHVFLFILSDSISNNYSYWTTNPLRKQHVWFFADTILFFPLRFLGNWDASLPPFVIIALMKPINVRIEGYREAQWREKEEGSIFFSQSFIFGPKKSLSSGFEGCELLFLTVVATCKQNLWQWTPRRRQKNQLNLWKLLVSRKCIALHVLDFFGY